MISHLAGILDESSLTQVVIDVNGVGYEVMIPLSTAEKLPAVGAKIKLLTHYYVREDGVQLYGFMTSDERKLFRVLLNYVGGIGPKLALNVLSAMSILVFCNAVRENDIKLLSKINGVGKKTAERMIVELRDKLDQFESGGEYTISDAAVGALHHNASDAVLALETLGFKHDAATKVIRQICEKEEDCGVTLSAESLIRRALQILNG